MLDLDAPVCNELQPTDMAVPATQCYCCNAVDAHDFSCPVGLDLVTSPMDRIPRPANHPSVIERFIKYVRISTTRSWTNPETGETTPCHEWTGGKSRGGDRWSEKAWYGTFNPGGEVKGGIRAHVYIAWLFGIITALRVPEGMNLDHQCSNGLCVNPTHLDLTTAIENQWRRVWRTKGSGANI